MSSPAPIHRHGTPLQPEEPYTPRGSTFAALMRRRSSPHVLPYGRDEEEGLGHHGSLTSSGFLTPRRDTFTHSVSDGDDAETQRRVHDERRLAAILNNPQMRSMRLIGKAKRYRWERYWKTEEQLDAMTAANKPQLRAYYERNNMLIQQYLYIDRLLNSSLPHDLLNEYNELHAAAGGYSSRNVAVPATISEEDAQALQANGAASSPAHLAGSLAGPMDIAAGTSPATGNPNPMSGSLGNTATGTAVKKVNRTPKGIYRPAETTPLMEAQDDDDDDDAHDPDSDGEFLSRARPRQPRATTETSAPVPNAAEDARDARDARDTTQLLPSAALPSYGAVATTGTERGATVDGGRGTAEETGGAGSASPTLAEIPLLLEEDEDVDSSAPVVTLAIYVNFAANAILLAGKLAVVLSVPSISVLASLVDAVLDFLSTAIVWTTTWMISNQDQYRYPVGRRRLEPLGILVFSVIMITSFAQVMLQAVQRLAGDDHAIIELGVPAIATMLSTIVIKGLCWLWCRMVKNSSVQALADDAWTDVIFNAGSIAFPIVGFYARIWWLDALGGLLLSLVVIYNWSRTSIEHIKRLSGFSATADQRNILLYLTMRFAKTIKAIQGLQAYHAGDKLIVEVDIVLDANMSLKDSHDLSESLQYVIESVPIVDRAFVHADYADYNLPTHMEQQAE